MHVAILNCACMAEAAYTHLPYVRNKCWPLLQATLISQATTMSSGAAEVATACSSLLRALQFSRHSSISGKWVATRGHGIRGTVDRSS
jgi:hypothetical protein